LRRQGLPGEAVARLISARQPSGGWGWRVGQPANTECTALAVMAVAAHRAVRADAALAVDDGLSWLASRQRADGGWPLGDQVMENSWMTGLAVLALAGSAAGRGKALRGAEWLLGRESRSPSWLHRLQLRLSPASSVADQDPRLSGWPWTDGTTAWVEPTVWALLAVKALFPDLPQARARKRVVEAEQMLADRMCVGGGWNYGNKRIMGVELPPYPDTTALALIALHDAPSEDVTGTSIRRLRELTAGRNSTLVLALSVLALRLHGEDVASLRAALLDRLGSTDLSGDIRALAFALLALDEDTAHFRVSRHA
jgi:hypothetical protein